MKKGMTNQLFIATNTAAHIHPSTPATTSADPAYDKVVVRVFGLDTQTFFDREYEEFITRRLSKRGIGCKILTEFGSGRIEAFLEGRTLECVDLSDPRISYLCAKALAALHSKNIPINARLIEKAKRMVEKDAQKLLPLTSTEATNTDVSERKEPESPSWSVTVQSSHSLVATFDALSLPSSPAPPTTQHSTTEELPAMSSTVGDSDVDSSIYTEPLLYFRIRHWFTTARQLSFTHNDKQNRIFQALQLDSAAMSDEIEWLCEKLQSLNSPIVFCHNDLQEGNLILETKPASKNSMRRKSSAVEPAGTMPRAQSAAALLSNGAAKSQSQSHSLTINTQTSQQSIAPESPMLTSEDLNFDSLHRLMSAQQSQQPPSQSQPQPLSSSAPYSHWRLHMIDFEYSSYNPRGFDLANHLCEHGIDYNVSDWPGFTILDCPPVVPSQSHTLRFLETYLTHYHRHAPSSSEPVMTDELRAIVREALWFSLASHMKWAMWGVIQAAKSAIHFGYMEYAQQRLACYRKAKALLVAWEADPSHPDWPMAGV